MVYPNSAHGHNLSLYKVEEEENKSVSESTKWMSSKIRLTRKMITPTNSTVATNNIAFNTTTTTPTFQNHQGHGNTQTNASTHNGNSIIRVCSDCNTSSTPLWRSGPKGPKSLCNACGIRQRKARRAMAEAANGFATNSMVASSTKTRVVHHKEKKSRTKHFAQYKSKSKATSTTIAGTSEGEKKLDFKDFAVSLRNNSAFQQVFPRDEVAEAALLLMELSCGFVYF
ncbi:GATA transcription factor 21-like [Gastrolobium bilobum]|uniref:GATA transcription factor 21-like n=1 Tax=Gastrolobium bilobum TaxID=150636 RepID=UPI002AB2855D|nr:GATA transcription factor 21-like [Gastrolobium bilobum]